MREKWRERVESRLLSKRDLGNNSSKGKDVPYSGAYVSIVLVSFRCHLQSRRRLLWKITFLRLASHRNLPHQSDLLQNIRSHYLYTMEAQWSHVWDPSEQSEQKCENWCSSKTLDFAHAKCISSFSFDRTEAFNSSKQSGKLGLHLNVGDFAVSTFEARYGQKREDWKDSVFPRRLTLENSCVSMKSPSLWSKS